MTKFIAILRVSLYSKLLLPIIFVACLGVFIVHKGVHPDPIWVAFDLQQIASLSAPIWVIIVTGIIGFLLGSWVWILRPKSFPALLFALSGVATLAFTFSPLPDYFATPISPDLSIHFSRLNMYGASLFGIVMCALLLIYPSRLPYSKIILPLLCTSLIIFTVWASSDLRKIDYFVQLITFVEMLLIILFSIWQIQANKGQADKYVVAIWLSACVIIGSGPFIALVAMPVTFGYPPRIAPHYAFAFFNLLYIGFAIGLLRLRLFNLGSWAFQLFFHAGLAILFIAIDLTLMSTLALQQGVASTITMLTLAIVYLPIRGWLTATISGQKNVNQADMFQSVVETGLKPSGQARAISWVNLLRETFKPLQISENHNAENIVSLSSDGQNLCLPEAMGAPALILQHKYNGRALFNKQDQKLAVQVMSLMSQVDESRRAYDRGVNEERSRIGRDIHDNIGAQLLQALHSEKTVKKDEKIRESLSDLRDVINNASVVHMPLSEMLADLRAETAERVSRHDITLKWSMADFEDLNLKSDKLHALRSVLREAVSNVIKHAQATHLDVQLKRRGGEIEFYVEDDGQGLARPDNDAREHEGQGLKNMRSRIENLGGEFDLNSTGSGTRLSARLNVRAGEK